VIAVEPTVPKLIESPCTVPLMGVLELLKDEILMVPLSFEPDCVQVRVNEPWYEPLYCPDHVPERLAEAGAAVDGAVLAAGVALVA
jgi:hypothetical protein